MRANPKNTMAVIIRKRFRQTGWSIKQLAERSGVAYVIAHGVVTGTRDPVLATAAKLCAALGLELRPVRKPKRR